MGDVNDKDDWWKMFIFYDIEIACALRLILPYMAEIFCALIRLFSFFGIKPARDLQGRLATITKA